MGNLYEIYKDTASWEERCRARREQYLRDANRRLIVELVAALKDIKGLLGPDGEYAICKADGTKMWLGDDMIVGGAFERADAAIAKAGGEG